MTVFLGFGLLFVIGWILSRRKPQTICISRERDSNAVAAPAFALIRIGSALSGDCAKEHLPIWLYFLADLLLLILAWKATELRSVSFLGGLGAFAILAVWSAGFLRIELLNHELGAFLVFGILHSAFPIILQRLEPVAFSVSLGQSISSLRAGTIAVPGC